MNNFDYIWHKDIKYSKHNVEYWIKHISKNISERVIIYFRIDEYNKIVNKSIIVNFSKLETINSINGYIFNNVLFTREIKFKNYESIIKHYDLHNKNIKFINSVLDLYDS